MVVGQYHVSLYIAALCSKTMCHVPPTYAGLRVFLEKLECAPDNPLVVTHCTRNDIILGFLAHAQKVKEVRLPVIDGTVVAERER